MIDDEVFWLMIDDDVFWFMIDDDVFWLMIDNDVFGLWLINDVIDSMVDERCSCLHDWLCFMMKSNTCVWMFW